MGSSVGKGGMQDLKANTDTQFLKQNFLIRGQLTDDINVAA